MAGMRSTTAHENDAVVVVFFKNVSPAASKLLWNASQETNIILNFYPPLLGQFFSQMYVFSSHLFCTSGLLDIPSGVTQEEGHTGFLIHFPSAVLAP